jgi:hypothetical protein
MAGDAGGFAKPFLAVIAAYVQADTGSMWAERVNGWIDSLAGNEPGWTVGDRLALEVDDVSKRFAKLRSVHSRQQNLADIELRHLWIEMNT